ncbi:L,D-transpeptidase [Polycladidibacter hongkongensis]|uniref:L,D-transpeptidase n=1 Tax=Polycladidibacter hongkongensis TaxID=1647556 RepID=UPI0009E89D4C|nr:L,D-transpeptidase [Pseudovibrio hongkongensis]
MRFGVGLGLAAAATFTCCIATMVVSTQAVAGQYYNHEEGRWVTYKDSPATAARKARKKYKRKVVRFYSEEAPGTIVVDTQNRFLYHLQEGGKAMRYGIGVGREGFEWSGSQKVTRKAKWPRWTPPPEMRVREREENGRELPAYMEGGPDNPLGARALYLGSTIYRIHGTNEDWSIGHALSSGCIRMFNEDVEYLYDQVKIGTKVVVQ